LEAGEFPKYPAKYLRKIGIHAGSEKNAGLGPTCSQLLPALLQYFFNGNAKIYVVTDPDNGLYHFLLVLYKGWGNKNLSYYTVKAGGTKNKFIRKFSVINASVEETSQTKDEEI
jgi:hypothetical protein